MAATPFYIPTNTRVLISPHPCQQLFPCFVFLIVVILLGVRWYHTVVLICISLMISNAEHLFMCLLAICIPLKCLFKSFAHFQNWLGFCCVELYEFFIYSAYWPLIRYMICKYFLPFAGLTFHSVDCVFWCTEDFYFYVVQFIYFFFCSLGFW